MEVNGRGASGGGRKQMSAEGLGDITEYFPPKLNNPSIPMRAKSHHYGGEREARERERTGREGGREG